MLLKEEQKTFTDLEPQNPTLNSPFDSIDQISPQPSDLGL
jgi:hypothetical protein